MVRTTGTNPRTANQTKYRQVVPHLNQRWNYVLSDAQRASWRAFAATQPVLNRLGVTTTLSGHQMFQKLNGIITMGGNAPINTPPASTAISVPLTGSMVATHGSPGTLTHATTTTAIGGTEQITLFASPPMNPGRNYISTQLRLLGYFTPDFGPVNIYTYWQTIFGTFPAAAGQRIFWRYYVSNYTTGIISPALQGSTLIV